MQLTREQQTAIKNLSYWVKKPKTQFITLGGFAGTGKTTLIAELRKQLDTKNKVAFVSFTGKAARVLKTKLKESGTTQKKDFVGTIHSLIYSPIEDEKTDIIVGWEKKEKVPYDLIIIDEASMVNREIWEDLLSFGKQIIAVGDHGQLPPIHGKFNLMSDPHIKLEEIHRQAKENPIIELSFLARTKGHIPFKKYSENVMKINKDDFEAQEEINDLLQSFDTDTMVLCGYNNTRIKLNQFIRGNLGFENPRPIKGDQVICLRNNHKEQIFNGMIGKLESIEDADDKNYLVEVIFEDDMSSFKGVILKEQFNAPQALNFTNDRKKTLNADLFDFGYALTVHKAQGSQARRVILFEERFSRMDDEMWRKWLYTAVTRAESELFIVA